MMHVLDSPPPALQAARPVKVGWRSAAERSFMLPPHPSSSSTSTVLIKPDAHSHVEDPCSLFSSTTASSASDRLAPLQRVQATCQPSTPGGEELPCPTPRPLESGRNASVKKKGRGRFHSEPWGGKPVEVPKLPLHLLSKRKPKTLGAVYSVAQGESDEDSTVSDTSSATSSEARFLPKDPRFMSEFQRQASCPVTPAFLDRAMPEPHRQLSAESEPPKKQTFSGYIGLSKLGISLVDEERRQDRSRKAAMGSKMAKYKSWRSFTSWVRSSSKQSTEETQSSTAKPAKPKLSGDRVRPSPLSQLRKLSSPSSASSI